jgi:hypothetical protein
MLLLIQAAMGWTDSHLYEIAPGMWDGAGPIPTGVVLARSTRARLASGDVLNDIGTKTPRYLYDLLLSRSPPQHHARCNRSSRIKTAPRGGAGLRT